MTRPPSASSTSTWAASRAAVAVLVAVVVAVFAASMSGAFVFDDHRFIVDNPVVRNPESWSRFLTDAGTADPAFPQGIVRPLRTFEFALDHAVFGLSATAFHVHSLLWHVASATLLLFVLRRLLGDPRAMAAGRTSPSGGGARAAFAAALLWAVHPAQVESVAWISSRGDVAAGACSLAAVLCALRSKGADLDFAASLAASMVALLYKETAIAVPLVVAALRWTKHSRAPLWPYVAGAAFYFFVYRRNVQPHGMGVTFVLGGSTAGTFATMIRAFGFYLVETLLPAQSLDWYMTPSTSFADAAVVAWLAVHAALVASAFVLRTRAPLWTLAVAWFYAFLLPVANWPFFTGIPTAERFLYLPLAGAAIACGWLLVRAPRAAFVAAFVAAAALGAAAIARAGLWRDDESMRRGVLADHESPRFRELEGEAVEFQALVSRGQASAMPEGPNREETEANARRLLEEALDHVHRALDEWYAFEMVRRSSGLLAMRAEYNASKICHLLGREDEALFHADEALAVRDDVRPEPHYDRAWPLLALGFAPQAIDAMQRARSLGFEAPSAEIGGFFLKAADACESDRLFVAAQLGYASAVDAAPTGPLRDEAQRRLDALRSRRLMAEDEARERAAVAALDARLAALPLSCPVRRDHSPAK